MFIAMVSLSRSTVYKIFDGSKMPKIDELEEFARLLDVPIEDLYESEYSRENMRSEKRPKIRTP